MNQSERAWLVERDLTDALEDLDRLTGAERHAKWLRSLGVDPDSPEAEHVHMVLERDASGMPFTRVVGLPERDDPTPNFHSSEPDERLTA